MLLKMGLTVYNYYRKWQHKWIWEKLNHTLCGQIRSKLGKSILTFVRLCSVPEAITADSQSVKMTEKSQTW